MFYPLYMYHSLVGLKVSSFLQCHAVRNLLPDFYKAYPSCISPRSRTSLRVRLFLLLIPFVHHVIGQYLARPDHHSCVVRRKTRPGIRLPANNIPAPPVTPEAWCEDKMQSGRHLFALYALLLLTLPDELTFQVL